ADAGAANVTPPISAAAPISAGPNAVPADAVRLEPRDAPPVYCQFGLAPRVTPTWWEESRKPRRLVNVADGLRTRRPTRAPLDDKTQRGRGSQRLALSSAALTRHPALARYGKISRSS